jgi:hypothetical protein
VAFPSIATDLSLESEVLSFLSALTKVYRASPNTLAAYRSDLRGFNRFQGDIDIESITRERIRAYLIRVPNRATRQRYLATIKRFFHHLENVRRSQIPSAKWAIRSGKGGCRPFWARRKSRTHRLAGTRQGRPLPA